MVSYLPKDQHAAVLHEIEKLIQQEHKSTEVLENDESLSEASKKYLRSFIDSRLIRLNALLEQYNLKG